MSERAYSLAFTIAALALLAYAGFMLTQPLMTAASLEGTLKSIDVSATDSLLAMDLKVQVRNSGPLPLKDVELDVLLSYDGQVLATGRGGPSSIPAGGVAEIPVRVQLDLSKVSSELLESLLKEDLKLQLALKGAAWIGDQVKASVQGEGVLPWGAPLHGLSFGQLEAELVDGVVKIEVPVSFENHSPYIDVVGEVSVELRDEKGAVIGEGSLSVNAPRGSAFQGTLEAQLSLTTLPQELLFEDASLNYSAVVEWSLMGAVFTTTQPAVIPWGAPLHGFNVGKPTARLYNETHLVLEVPVSFENHSPYIDLDLAVDLTLMNATTGEVAGVGLLNIVAERGSSFEGSAEIYVGVDEALLTRLAFSDLTLSYVMEAYISTAGLEARLTQPIEYEWQAPLSNLVVGDPGYEVVDGQARVYVPLSFENRSPMSLEGSVAMKLYRGGTLIAQGTPVEVSVSSGASFSQELEAYVDAQSLTPGSYRVVLEVATSFGVFTQEAVLSV